MHLPKQFCINKTVINKLFAFLGFLTNNTMRGYIFVTVYFLACISACEALYSKKVFNSSDCSSESMIGYLYLPNGNVNNKYLYKLVLIDSQQPCTMSSCTEILEGKTWGTENCEFFSVVTSNDWSIVSRGMSDDCDNFDVQFGGKNWILNLKLNFHFH